MSLDALALKNFCLLVQVPKPPTIHYQPATWKLFDSPEYYASLLLYYIFVRGSYLKVWWMTSENPLPEFDTDENWEKGLYQESRCQ